MEDQKIGVMLIGEEVRARLLPDVRAAAIEAGIPENYVKEVKPRNAFLRGMRQMIRDKLIDADLPADKALDNEDKVRVAFVTRIDQEGHLGYQASVVIDFDKKSEMVTVVEKPATVSENAILTKAHEIVQAAKSLCNTGDIGRLVKRFMDSRCRRIAIRPGVYFIPRQHEEAARIIRDFYGRLNFKYMTLPVGYDTNDLEAVQAGIVKDLKQNISDTERKIVDLKKDGTLSKHAARGRLKALRKSLIQYRELAASTGATLKELCAQAGQAGQKLLNATMTETEALMAIQGGKTLDPLSAELFVQSEDFGNVVPALKVEAAPVDGVVGVMVSEDEAVDVGVPVL
jgi:hypothetical protein